MTVLNKSRLTFNGFVNFLPNSKASTIMRDEFDYSLTYGSSSSILSPHGTVFPSIQLINTIKTISSFSSLKEDWNSYGALPIAEIAIDNSIEYVKQLYKAGQEVYYTVPTPESGVLVELKNNSKSIELLFDEDGSADYTLYRNGDFEKDGKIAQGTTQINELIVWLNLEV